MTNCAILTIGATDLQIRNLSEAIRTLWNVVDKSSSVDNIIEGAKKKRFSYLLVIDMDAIGKEKTKIIEDFGVEIIEFRDKMAVVSKLKEEIEKSKRSVKVKFD